MIADIETIRSTLADTRARIEELADQEGIRGVLDPAAGGVTCVIAALHAAQKHLRRPTETGECTCPYPDPTQSDMHRGCPIHGDEATKWAINELLAGRAETVADVADRLDFPKAPGADREIDMLTKRPIGPPDAWNAP